MGIAGVIVWLIGVIYYLLNPPDPPSRLCRDGWRLEQLGVYGQCQASGMQSLAKPLKAVRLQYFQSLK